MIKAIIFDLGGVCFEIDWIKINEEMMKKFKISILIKSSANQKLIELYNLALEGKIDVLEFFRGLSEDKANPEEVIKFYKEAYKKYKKINHELLELIKKLKDKYKIVCLSDTNRANFETHQEQNLFEHFNEVFASFKLGSKKTDKKTFIKVLNQLKLKPEETVFIDDNSKNIENAKSVGLWVLRYESYNKLVEDLKKLGVI